MTIKTKAIVDISFTREDKEILEKACKLADDYNLSIRNTLDNLNSKSIEVDCNLLNDCYRLISDFEDTCASLDDLITTIASFEKEHC